MTVKFVDSQTGEVVGAKKASKPARDSNAVNIAGVVIVLAFVVGVFVGGGVATNIQQDQVDNLKVQLERTEVIR